MNYYISYFYQLRNFPINALPLSTAMYDPIWFHLGKGAAHSFKDKNGIWNGLRAEPLVPRTVHEIGESLCKKNCGQEIPCAFMRGYTDYLNTLDFSEIISRAEHLAKKAIPQEYGKPCIIFLVHEPPYIKCAERPCLIEWFSRNGVTLREWGQGLK